MPIIIKEFEWSQTESTVIIKIPLRGIHQSKINLFYTPHYIKASYEQYFFEVFLFSTINPKESTCTTTKLHIVFELLKSEPLTWEQLEANIPKSEKQQLKTKYIEEENARIQKEAKELDVKKSELKKIAVREQMALDAEQRQEIEDIKEREKNAMLKQMQLLKSQAAKKTKKKVEVKKCEIIIQNDIPPLRTTNILNVAFTPREFPTPCRESRMEEEMDWLRKQAEARRSVGFVSEDLRPEEHNPQFLKAKGDDFLRSRNFLGAISAYSFGIGLNDKFSDLYVGRAEAHLALGNYNKAVQDCSTAINLMQPVVPANLRERAACIGWRGISLIKLGLQREGIEELKASLRLLPNESFSNQLENAIEQLNDTD